MKTWWYKVNPSWEVTEDFTQNYALTSKVFSDGDVLLIGDSVTAPLQQEPVGVWNKDGTIAEDYTVNTPLYEQIRPLGNNPDGSATGLLRAIYPAGMPPYRLSEDSLYPPDIDPFGVEIRHKEFGGTWPGWGWRAEMTYGTRDPSVYAIGVYSDPECTQYLYTTGAFAQMESDWQVDENGNPVTVWATESPAGRVNDQKEDWHLALLYASEQHGYQTLSATAENIEYLFWSVNQDGSVNNSGASNWRDSGQTVVGMAGTVTLVQDKSAFQIGTKTKINDFEAEITGFWAGGNGLIQTPYHAYTAGSKIFIK